MASENVEQTDCQLRNTLRECDRQVQEAMCRINALTLAASSLLALEAGALVKVERILDLIRDHADSLEDAVNASAEEHGANWSDAPKPISDRLWAQHHAMRDAVAHG